MPLINPASEWERTTELTKKLRSRDYELLDAIVPVDQLLRDAATSGKIYFPRFPEWVFEWLAQRLKEDGGEAGRRARLSCIPWDLMRELSNQIEMADVAASLKRHSFARTLCRTMSELKTSQDILQGPVGRNGGATVRISLKATEELLLALSHLIELLDRNSRGDAAVVVAMRPSVETAASTLGDFYAVCGSLLVQGARLDEAYICAFHDLWRNSTWGNAATHKVSLLWSEKCFALAAYLLSLPNLPSSSRIALEGMISRYIFHPNEAPNAKMQHASASSMADIALSLSHLKATPMPAFYGEQDSDILRVVPNLFKIALRSPSAESRTRPDPKVVERIYDLFQGAIVQGTCQGMDSVQVATVVQLLRVVQDTGNSLPTPSLARIVSDNANLASCAADVRWGLIETVLTCDADAFFDPASNDLEKRLLDAITRATPSPIIENVIKLLIEGYHRARNLIGFIQQWKDRLEMSPGSVWGTELMANFFVPHVQKALTEAQIVGLVTDLRMAEQWSIIDAVLRGITSQATRKKLCRGEEPKLIAQSAATRPSQRRAWRVAVWMAQIAPSAVDALFDKASKLLKESTDHMLIFLASEVILIAAQYDSTYLPDVQNVLWRITNSWENSEVWNGMMEALNERTFPHAMSACVAKYHKVVEATDRNTRNIFSGSLVTAALAHDHVRVLLRDILKDAEFFECPALKDAVLNSLIYTLQPFTQIAEGPFPTMVLPQIPLGDRALEFVLTCIDSYPLESLKRNTREKLLNICLLLSLSRTTPLVESLISKIWKVGNATSWVATSPHAYRLLSQNGARMNVTRQVLRYAIEGRDQSSTQNFLSGVIQSVDERPAEDVQFGAIVVTELWNKIDEVLLKSKPLADLRLVLLGYLGDLILREKCPHADQLQLWSDLWELDRGKGANPHIVNHVIRHFVTGHSWKPEARVQGLRLICNTAEKLDDYFKVTALTTLVYEELGSERGGDIAASYRSTLSRLTTAQFEDILLWVSSAITPDQSSVYILRVFATLVSGIQKQRAPSVGLHDILINTQTKLARQLPNAGNFEVFSLLLSSLNDILLLHPWSTTQYCVDSVIGALSLIVSSRGPKFETTSPNVIFIAVVNVLSSILSLHRNRVRGRYHIVVALLQGLLCCLFSPTQKHKPEASVPARATWLSSKELGPESALALARILQMLCEPPVSTVRTIGRDLMESQRVKERRRVAKAVGPLLECYVRRSLEGSIEHTVRAQLLHGIGSILKLIGREGRNAVAGNLNSEGRALLRNLWATYDHGSHEKT